MKNLIKIIAYSILGFIHKKNGVVISDSEKSHNVVVDFLLFGAPLGERFKYENSIEIDDIRNVKITKENEEEILEHLDFLIKEDIKNLIKDKKKIGLLLSGGIDSSIILSYLSELGTEVFAYTWGGWGIETTDVVFSKYSAKKFGVKKHVVVCPDNNYDREKKLFVDHIKKIKIPLDFSSSIPYIFLKSKIMEDGVDIVFNGQNADTLFMAYPAPEKINKLYSVFNFLYLDILITPLHLMRIFKSSGTWKFAKTNIGYERRLLDFWRNIGELKMSFQQKIIIMEEIFTEARGCQNHQKKIFELDGINVLNPYYSKEFVKYLISIPDYYRKKNNYSKYLFYQLAKRRGVPEEVINKPKKGLSYGYSDFMKNQKHLPIYEEIAESNLLNEFIDIKNILNNTNVKNNFFIFDRIRSTYYFLKNIN